MVSLQNKSCATTTRASRLSVHLYMCVYVRVAAFPPAIEGTFPCVCVQKRIASSFNSLFAIDCVYRTIGQARILTFLTFPEKLPI